MTTHPSGLSPHEHRSRPLRRITLVALLAAATALTGCTSGNSADSGGVVPDTQQVSPGEGELGARDIDAATDRDVVSTASVSLTSADPVDAAEQAVLIATDAGGRVDNRTDSPATGDSAASASLTLRIPAESLDDALAEIKTVGDLRQASLNSTDVTDQVTDLDARITALRASVNRLLALIERATTTADLIDLETALSERQAELDSLEAQRDAVGDAIEFATVHVDISAPGAVAGAAPGDFWGGIVVGFTALVGFFSGLLVVVGILLPWVILLAIVALIAWQIVRRRRSVPAQHPAPRPNDSPRPERDTGIPASGTPVPPRPPLPPDRS